MIFFRICRRMLVTAMVVLVPTRAMADASASAFSQVLQPVLASHPSLMVKRSSFKAAELGVEVAERQYWPTPSINADRGPHDSQGRHQAWVARLSMPVYTGGQLAADLELALARQASAEAELDLAKRELAWQLIERFRGWWLKTAQVDMLRQSASKFALVHAMVVRRAQAGVSSQVDVMHAQARLDRLMQDTQLALQQQSQALLQLKVFAGQELYPVYEPLDQVSRSMLSSFSVLEERVLSAHPQLRMAESARMQAQADERKAQASLKPVLNLRAEKQYGAYLGVLDAGTRVYLSAQTQLGAGFSAVTLTEQALARSEAADASVALTKQQLKDQVLALWNEERMGMEIRENLRSQLIVQDELVDAGVRLFRAGRRSWQELLSLLQDWHQIQQQMSETEASVMSARLRLQVMGNAMPGIEFQIEP